MEFEEEEYTTDSESNDSTTERSYWRIGRRTSQEASNPTVRRSPRLAAQQRVDQASSGNRRNPQRSRRGETGARRNMHDN